jgi:ribosomal protein S18 acetylase RimI-like enzyme
MPTMQRVVSSGEIDAVAALAHEIWNHHFPPIIGQAQVDYMLDTMQSAAAITRQIRERGYEYYLVFDGDERSGYFAIVPDEDGSMQLSKLYLKHACRGRGLGRAVLEWIERECAARGARQLWLTVAKGNADSIAFYERAGFTIAGPIAIDIGGGFVMNDHRMVKNLS